MTKNKTKMKKDRIIQWIAALRSGRYKKCTGALCRVIHSNRYYCCLGVASEEFLEEADILREEIRVDGQQFITFGDNRTNLNSNLDDLLGVARLEQILVHMNDTEGKTFIEIADFLESKVQEGYFDE